MYKVLDKDMIEKEIVAYIPRTSPGISPDGSAARDRQRLNLQAQDRCPMGTSASKGPVRGCCTELAIGLPPLPQVAQVRVLERLLDKVPDRHKDHLSSVNLDGSHTPAKRGGENVEYQGRRSAGLTLGQVRTSGANHNDLYDMEVQFEAITATLEQAEIPVGGCFRTPMQCSIPRTSGNHAVKKDINPNVSFNRRSGLTAFFFGCNLHEA